MHVEGFSICGHGFPLVIDDDDAACCPFRERHVIDDEISRDRSTNLSMAIERDMSLCTFTPSSSSHSECHDSPCPLLHRGQERKICVQGIKYVAHVCPGGKKQA